MNIKYFSTNHNFVNPPTAVLSSSEKLKVNLGFKGFSGEIEEILFILP